jgi:hypothetical protein
MNRLGRVIIVAVSQVKDEDGRVYQISYSSAGSNDQIIILTVPAPMTVDLSTPTLVAHPNSTLKLDVTLNRGQLTIRPTTIQLLVPPHIGASTAKAVELSADDNQATLEINVDSQPGPFNMPLKVRATTNDKVGSKIIAHSTVEVVPLPDSKP